jgi:GT2 family glycosyltransferase
LSTAVVILNYNGKEHLFTFLPSVVKFSAEAEIWVADNGSQDDSISFIEATYPSIKLLKLPVNLGFAGGYNAALKEIKADNYILLNSDVEVSENWLPPLINQLAQDNQAACQPKILSFSNKEYFEYAGAAGGFLDKWAYPFCRGRIFDTCEKDKGQYNDTKTIFWATGACLAIKSKVFHEQGGFDERFFAHMEEIDLCWRINNTGLTITYVPESTVFHLGGGTLNKSNPRKTFLNYRNSLAMLFKNLPTNEVLPKLLIRLVLDGISGVKLLTEGKWQEFFAIIKAHFSFYGMIPYLIKKSKNNTRSSLKLYSNSIVWAYFVKGKRTYSELNHD